MGGSKPDKVAQKEKETAGRAAGSGAPLASAPASKGDAGAYRITDKAALKTHRGRVRRGRGRVHTCAWRMVDGCIMQIVLACHVWCHCGLRVRVVDGRMLDVLACRVCVCVRVCVCACVRACVHVCVCVS